MSLLRNKIYANYNLSTIRVYQAYNNKIAEEAISLGTFGPSFKLDRMTWIKPSFLWMMYRSGWGTKENQERILAIDICREGFDTILSKAVMSKYNGEAYSNYEDWKAIISKSEVIYQFDPDRDVWGSPLGRRAIQLGIKGTMLERYVNEWIANIVDISKWVHHCRANIEQNTFNFNVLPEEKEYII